MKTPCNWHPTPTAASTSSFVALEDTGSVGKVRNTKHVCSELWRTSSFTTCTLARGAEPSSPRLCSSAAIGNVRMPNTGTIWWQAQHRGSHVRLLCRAGMGQDTTRSVPRRQHRCACSAASLPPLLAAPSPLTPSPPPPSARGTPCDTRLHPLRNLRKAQHSTVQYSPRRPQAHTHTRQHAPCAGQCGRSTHPSGAGCEPAAAAATRSLWGTPRVTH